MKIGIVGSMHLAAKIAEIKSQLEKQGHQVMMNSLASEFMNRSDEEIEKMKQDQKLHQDAMMDFWKQLREVDAILVVNLDRKGIKNYIGGNTLMEIGFAYVLGQKIYFYNPIPEIEYYKTELEAIKPIVINGDLAQIH
jgi:hypothetical protein